MDIILDEAVKRGMKVWILDDSHFPTGYANGALEDKPDTLHRQSICCRIMEVEGNGTLHIPSEQLWHPDPFEILSIENEMFYEEPKIFEDDRLLEIFAVEVSKETDGFTKEGRRIDLRNIATKKGMVWQAPEGKWKVYTLHLSRNFGCRWSYINMMKRDSCRILIDAVYEPHYAHYKDLFGTTISGFFSDEPEMGNGHLYAYEDALGTMTDLPWSEEAEELLKQKLGKEGLWKLALLWENGSDPDLTAEIRYCYMDTVTRLVQKNFSEQIGGWCRSHGVEYIGHLIEDDDHHSRLGCSLGHYFRGLRGQDMAGIDDIGGQVMPQGEDLNYNYGGFQHRNGNFYHYVLAKLASSAASIESRKNGNSMCEIFGNYGWEEGVQLEKYLADHFMVRGVNYYVPHAFSAKKFPDPDCPPHFYAHGNHPQYRHFGALMGYMNRVCELISGGKRIVHVAIMYDGEADWTGSEERSGQTARILYDHQIDYDIIPQDVFAERKFYKTAINQGKLKVNTQEYSMIIIPPTNYITEAFADAVDEMCLAGIDILFMERKPTKICEIEKRQEKNSLEQKLEHAKRTTYQELEVMASSSEKSEMTLLPANNRIRMCHYEHKDQSGVLLFVNEGEHKYVGDCILAEGICRCTGNPRNIYGYDAWNNQIYPLKMNENKLKLCLEPRESMIVIFDLNETQQMGYIPKQKLAALKESGAREEDISENWKRSICKSINYPAFFEEKLINLPDKLCEESPLFSGFVRYERTIYISDAKEAVLVITDAAEGMEVFLNDISLGIQIVPTYVYDLSQAAQIGENRLVIEVATTLEREMSVYSDQTKKPTCKSGITGKVLLIRQR